jgi:hypothetical protein
MAPFADIALVLDEAGLSQSLNARSDYVIADS